MPRKATATGGTNQARVTRHSRDLAVELKRIETALKKAQATAEKLRKALGAAARPRVTRHSRDL